MIRTDKSQSYFVFVKSPTIGGALIRLVTWSPHDHIAIFHDGMIYDINYTNNVGSYKIAKYIQPFPSKPHKTNKIYIEWDFPLEPTHKVMDKLGDMSDFKYDLIGALLYPIRRWFVRDKEGQAHCVKFANNVAKSSNFDITEGKFLNTKEFHEKIKNWDFKHVSE